MQSRKIMDSRKRKHFKGIKIIFILLSITVIAAAIIYINKGYSININIIKKAIETTVNNPSVKLSQDAIKKMEAEKKQEEEVLKQKEAQSMQSFYGDGQYLKYDLGKEKIDMTKVDELMKVFTSTKIVTVFSEKTPLILGALCMPGINDKGIAAEMIRRINNLESINTIIGGGVDIKIPVIP